MSKYLSWRFTANSSDQGFNFVALSGGHQKSAIWRTVVSSFHGTAGCPEQQAANPFFLLQNIGVSVTPLHERRSRQLNKPVKQAYWFNWWKLVDFVEVVGLALWRLQFTRKWLIAHTSVITNRCFLETNKKDHPVPGQSTQASVAHINKVHRSIRRTPTKTTFSNEASSATACLQLRP